MIMNSLISDEEKQEMLRDAMDSERGRVSLLMGSPQALIQITNAVHALYQRYKLGKSVSWIRWDNYETHTAKKTKRKTDS